MKSLTNSWELIKASAKVLVADKELMIFPIISVIGTLIITVTFFLPFLFSNILDSLIKGGSGLFGVIVLFLYYIVQYSVVFFCNTALVGAAIIRLRGGDPTIGDGIRIASRQFFPILGFAVIAATVGMLLKIVSEKSKGFGRFIVSLVGFAWNIATFLVVPVLAVENVGPIEAIKRSVALLRKTWGEQIVGGLGLGAVFGLAAFVIIFPAIILVAILISLTQSWTLVLAVIALMVIALVLLGLIQSTLNGIFTAAVYQYAADGTTGSFFDPNLVKNAFRPTKGKLP